MKTKNKYHNNKFSYKTIYKNGNLNYNKYKTKLNLNLYNKVMKIQMMSPYTSVGLKI